MSARIAPTIALVGLVPLLAGCASWNGYTEHLAEPCHPWHSWPEIGGFYVGAAPLYPLAWLEAKAFHPSGNVSVTYGVFGPVMAWTGALVGLPLGTAFYVVGYPLEWAIPLDERRRGKKDASDPSAPPAEDQPDRSDGSR